MKTYGMDLDVEGLEDGGQNLYSNTYLTQIRNNPINSEPLVNVKENLDMLMAKIIKRTRKWVEWTSKKSRSRGTPTRAPSLVAASSSSQGDTASVMPSTAQGPTQPAGAGD